MAPGRRKLQKIQWGLETTAGTAVAATALWRGLGNTLEDQQVVEEIEELIGVLDGADRTAVTQLMGGLELAETVATFEQFPYLPAMAYGGPVTGTADGAGTGKVYTTNIPTTAAPTIKSYTVETGDDAEAEEMEYSFCNQFTVKGAGGETAKMSGTLLGRRVLVSTFTASIAVPTVEDAITSKGKVYLDAIGGTYGATQVSNQILGFELNYEALWVPKFTMDGNLFFSLPVYAGHKVMGKLTFEHDTAVKRSGGAKSELVAQTAKKLRIDLIGATTATAGTTYSTKHLIFDLPIKYTKAGVIDEQDGNDIVEMEFRSRYNVTAADQGKIIAVAELASLP